MIFKDFYLGIDPQSYFDLQLHLGRLRVEWGSTTPQDRGPHSDTNNRCTSGEGPRSL